MRQAGSCPLAQLLQEWTCSEGYLQRKNEKIKGHNWCTSLSSTKALQICTEPESELALPGENAGWNLKCLKPQGIKHQFLCFAGTVWAAEPKEMLLIKEVGWMRKSVFHIGRNKSGQGNTEWCFWEGKDTAWVYFCTERQMKAEPEGVFLMDMQDLLKQLKWQNKQQKQFVNSSRPQKTLLLKSPWQHACLGLPSSLGMLLQSSHPKLLCSAFDKSFRCGIKSLPSNHSGNIHKHTLRMMLSTWAYVAGSPWNTGKNGIIRK